MPGDQSCLVFVSESFLAVEYTLPAKYMNYFLFQRFFAFFWSVQDVSVIEIHSYEPILLLGSQFALNRPMKSKGSKTIMSLNFLIRLWLEF